MIFSKKDQMPDTSPAFFEKLYRASSDPWNFRCSEYEQARYRAILSALGGQVFDSAFEPGCSIGELTALLAPQCKLIDAIDCSAAAIEQAKSHCSHYPQVQVSEGRLPDDLPDKHYDLIVFSEIGYYFAREELPVLVARLWSRVNTGGFLVACHWLGQSEDHFLHGSEVHKIIGKVIENDAPSQVANDNFILQSWIKEAP